MVAQTLTRLACATMVIVAVGLLAIGLADVLACRALAAQPGVALRKARASLTAPW